MLAAPRNRVAASYLLTGRILALGMADLHTKDSINGVLAQMMA
ncbi:hypothetical protein BH23BAC4_BH23BAC4_16510 [soil metagenome]